MDTETHKIFIKGEDLTKDILLIEPDGNKINVMFKNGRSYSYSRSSIRLEPIKQDEQRAKKVFSYLRSIADSVGLNNDYGQNILLKNLNRINEKSKETVLYDFLSGEYRDNNSKISDTPLYPFGFNISQQQAVDNALTNQLSIIEGPPGTGKTQTILNIIANIVMAGKTVAVVSANNSATANVLEKLQKYDLGFMAAFLGSSSNIAAFNQTDHKLPDMSDWHRSNKWAKSTIKKIKTLHEKLLSMLAEQNRTAKNKQEFDALNTEYQHFHVQNPNINESNISHLSDDKSMRLWLAYEIFAQRNRRPNLIERIIFRYKYKIKDKQFFHSDVETVIKTCQQAWYTKRIATLSQDIEQSEKKLAKFNFSEKIKQYTDWSMQLVKDNLAKKYKKLERATKPADKDFLKSYPVILSTTYSLSNCLFDGIFDYVIIDEASQVDLVTGALALGCAQNAVIVGDLKQLPNVVDTENAKTTDAIFDKFEIPEVYRYKNHSLLSTVTKLFKDIPSVMLREHYRCHPKIIEFCNQRFYGGQLISLSRPNTDRTPLVVYKTKIGNHARNHTNHRQIDVIVDEIIPQQKLNVNDNSLGIVTPYRNQVTALQNIFKDTKVQADTVDKFQGREKNIIILSMVDNQISEFADQPNRLNVAISRAIDQLIVVTNGNEEEKDTNIGALIDYINYNNLTVVQSDISSVFDCLYKCYAEKRRQMIKSSVSEFDSENAMYDLITEVLKTEQFNIFDVALHVPLKSIFNDLSKLTNEEYSYANNIMTHCDFLIFDRVTKKPVLGIEVDGTKYHHENTKQYERDRMKDSIFATYNIPLIRFRTDGSQEKAKLMQALSNIIGR